MEIKKVSFIGLGLIGGSIAKAIRAYQSNVKIYAKASEKTVREAFSLGICENEGLIPDEELAKSDIIFLCCPVEVNKVYLELLKPYLTNDTILTDVGSVKGDIHKAAHKLGLNDFFVGGHPMAGSDKTGLSNSYKELIENCRYCLTTSDGLSNKKSRALAEFLRPLKVRTKLLGYDEHDRSAAAISHVPHIASSALCNLVFGYDDNSHMKDMLSTGFLDTTRIAKSDPDIWQQIFSENREAILPILDDYIKELETYKEAVLKNDKRELFRLYNEARKFREKVNR